MNALVVVARKNKVDEVHIAPEKKIEKVFLSVCHDVFTNFDDYTSDDVDAILEDGYADGNDCAVCIHHPHKDVDESKVLFIGLSDNILDTLTVNDSVEDARRVFIDAVRFLGMDDKDIAKLAGKNADYQRIGAIAVQVFAFEKEHENV